jgi:hypothetical protein
MNLNEAKAVAQRLRTHYVNPDELANTIDSLVQEIERLTKVSAEPEWKRPPKYVPPLVEWANKVDVEPVAWSYWQSCLNDEGTQTAPWVQRYSKFKPAESVINKDVTPLYPASALAALRSEIEGWKADQKENLRNQCDLHAQLTESQAEVARLKANAVATDDAIAWAAEHAEKIITERDTLRTQLTEARAEVERLREDAERYRWLRDNTEQTFSIRFDDAAIDAARAAMQGGKT